MMRLPFARPYRAFPELDRFTDEECNRLQFRARERSDDEPNHGCAMTFFIAAGVMFALAFVAKALLDTPAWKTVERRLGAWMHLIGIEVLLAVSFIAAVVGALFVRDRLLHRLIREQIARTTCPGCRASLLGAERSADSVRCGSCASVLTFAELGLESEDLGPPLIVMKTGVTCSGCRYALAELPISRGFVTCPECGRKTPVVREGAPLEAERKIAT